MKDGDVACLLHIHESVPIRKRRYKNDDQSSP